MTVRIKVYELAKELAVDPQTLVEVVARLGIDVKNTMTLLGTEEVRTIRDHYKKNKVYSKASPGGGKTAPASTKSSVTEKRVGSTVIRRRAAPKAEAKPAEEVTPVQEASPVVEESQQETSFSAETPVVETKQEAPAVEEAIEAAPEAVNEMTKEVEAAPTPVVEVAAPEKMKRRVYTSIIKKVAVEDHLSAKIGPKVAQAPRPKREEKKPSATPTRQATVSSDTPNTRHAVKEVELATEAAKELGKKKALERQSAVFKSSDYLKRELVHAMKKKKTGLSRPALKTQITTAAEHKRVVVMGEKITVSDFAKQMGIKATQLIAKLMGLGVTASINESIDFDTASLAAHEFQYEVKQEIFREEEYVPQVSENKTTWEYRAPVVTIMGHVDHGKTSLLDAIRKTQVAAGEAGGITQHIGAYTVAIDKGKMTFLDTPGHEAFTAMRARGAKVTDIVILVVSAVDGVQPQTLESINHAKAAGVPIIVAVNKTDLPDANADRIKQTLAGHDLAPEDWGGQTIYVPVSAKTGKGIDTLLENILLQAEMLELKANYNVPMKGAVVESRLDKNRGPVATVLVQHGRLKTGDIVVAGMCSGKVKAMTNSYGKRLDEALPSEPVEILGLDSVPSVGDDIFAVEDERKAREFTTARTDKAKQSAMDSRTKMSLEDFLGATGTTEKELRIILKGDVQGSVEALKEALSKLPQEKCKIRILHAGTGGVNESDVMLATASQAVILGFNIRPDVKAQKLAERNKIELRTYSIIYDLLEETKSLLLGMLDKIVKEKVIGRAEVRTVFNIPKIGTIAGSAVIDGKVIRGCFLRLLRDNRVIYEGKISSLRRFKEDVKEVASGFECGIGVENYSDVKLGDQFEAYIKEESLGVLT